MNPAERPAPRCDAQGCRNVADFDPRAARCSRCEIQRAVDDGERDHAYAVAAEFGVPASTVRALLRAESERQIRAAHRIQRELRRARATIIPPSGEYVAVAVAPLRAPRELAAQAADPLAVADALDDIALEARAQWELRALVNASNAAAFGAAKGRAA